MFEKFRFLTSGESHGKCLTAIIEGLPAGLSIDTDFINSELKRRQQGYGRGDRMNIETDTAEIVSGVRFGKTIGSPVTLVIYNKDYENWQKVMSTKAEDQTDEKAFYTYRPGHADYAGSVKYNRHDLRDILERSSARKTAIEVAVGAVAKLLLKHYGVSCKSTFLQIGQGKNEEEFRAEIDRAKETGDTLGGKFEVIYGRLPVGLGSHVHWDRAIDGRIAQAVMSIPAVKAVSFGNGENAYEITGSNFHDEMFLSDGKITRKTNNAGGVEGGMTNGEDLVVKVVMKPIPTLRTPLKTVDSSDMTETEAHFERSDTCAVEACSVVAEARIACVLANELMLKFPSDSI
ncbi:chorismate synthase [bacterium]|nr:chorismate synthase [bacterium]